jgi:hypothetical protein
MNPAAPSLSRPALGTRFAQKDFSFPGLCSMCLVSFMFALPLSLLEGGWLMFALPLSLLEGGWFMFEAG